ncbi:MAG: SBBP repeat-containing protein, partial [Pseudonocardiaceae bacterium]
DGKSLSYATYLGGSGTDTAAGIAVDGAGDAFVDGSTTSTDFRTAHPYQAACGGSCTSNAFVSEVNPTGTNLLSSTYLGGSGSDTAYGIALGPNPGSVYVVGETNSTDFPTMKPLQATCGGGCAAGSAFVSELNMGITTNTTLSYSTYLGGSAFSEGNAIAVDAAGSAYVTGLTDSTDFPLKNAFQTNFAPGQSPVPAFVVKLSPAGDSIVYSTFLSSGGFDQGLGIAVDGAPVPSALVVGNAGASGFPVTQGSFQPGVSGGGAFVVRISGPDDAVPPVLTGINPRGGPPAGGTGVNIAGSGFVGATAVHFGTVAAQFTVDSDTQISAVSPQGSDGTAAVTVTTASGTTAAGGISGFVYGQGLWTPTGPAAQPGAPSITLGGPACAAQPSPAYCGEVLMLEGSSAEVYDPNSGVWAATGSPLFSQQFPPLVQLADGDVLVVGGDFGDGTRTQIYHPGVADRANGAMGTFTEAAPLSVGIFAYPGTATTLSGPACAAAGSLAHCGEVLLAGGQDVNGQALTTAELYDPALDRWTATTPMNTAREQDAATLLPNGRVLVEGGLQPGQRNALGSAEIYNPADGSWTPTHDLAQARDRQTATLLSGPACGEASPSVCGQVLVVGGDDGGSLNSAELYDPGTGSWTTTG